MIFTRPLILSTCLTVLSTAVCADFSQEVADVSAYPFVGTDRPQTSQTSTHLRHFALIGEMLYLKPYLGKTPWLYADNFSQYTSSSNPAIFPKTIKTLEMDFDFGFRLGFGFNTSWMNMENQVTWMRLHTQTTQKLTPVTNIVAATNYTVFGQPLAYETYWTSLGYYPYVPPMGQIIDGQQSTNFEWDQIDAVSKIPLTPFKVATFSPLFGLRGLVYQISSKLTNIINAYGPDLATTPPFNNLITELKQTFNAVGLVGGLDGDVNFGQGFHLSALLDAALVYGNVKTSNNTRLNVPVVPTETVPVEYSYATHGYKVKPVFDFQATLSWNRGSSDGKMAFNIHMGYEVHYMPHLIEYVRIYIPGQGSKSQSYDSMLQGFNAGLGLSF